MSGQETGGRGNFWYSFDYGLAHFISFSGETDYYQSPESPFLADVGGANGALPSENHTKVTNGGPFGNINGNYTINENYEQWQWMKQDLANVDRTKTPWVFVQSHRPMYSSEVSAYQLYMRNAWENLFLEYKVDAYTAGHIHWFERMLPLAPNSTIVYDDMVDNHTYITGTGNSLTYLTNGQAGNIESHSNFLSDGDHLLNITAYLDMQNFGYSRLSVMNATTSVSHAITASVLTFKLWEFIRGADGEVHDYVYLTKGSN